MSAPRFELRRIDAEGNTSSPRIIPISELLDGVSAGRRGFLGASSLATALAAIGTGGCGQGSTLSKDKRAHKGQIRQLFLVPGEETLLSFSDDEELKRWSTESRSLIGEPINPPRRKKDKTGNIRFRGFAALAPNGKEILFLDTMSLTLEMYSYPEGQLLYGFGSDSQHVDFSQHPHAVAFSPQGDLIAVASFQGSGYLTPNSGLVTLWRRSTRKLVAFWSVPSSDENGVPHAMPLVAPIVQIAFTPDGKQLVTAQTVGPVMKVWQLRARSADGTTPPGELAWTIPKNGQFAISPDGRYLATSSPDLNEAGVRTEMPRRVLLWSLESHQELVSWNADPKQLTVMAFTPDSKMLITASANLMNVWSIPDGKAVGMLENMWDPGPPRTSSEKRPLITGGGITRLAFSPDGAFLYAADSTSRISKWSFADRQQQGYFEDPAADRASSGGGGGVKCTCDSVCTCIPVYR